MHYFGRYVVLVKSESASFGRRFAAAALFVVAQLVAGASPASADGPCSSLPYDSTYPRANWLTGGYQDHGGTIRVTRGNIRTYNGFVANHSNPDFRGAEAAWVALIDANTKSYAQVGWAKAPNTGFPFDPIFFVQYTNSAAEVLHTEFFGPAIFPPSVYTYYVRWDPDGGSGRIFQFVANNRHLIFSSALQWNPTAHESASEVKNYTGDQHPGDRTAHTTFRSVQWSPDDVNWFGSTFGTPANTYFVGSPVQAGNPVRTWDRLSIIDGSNFDSWDERCP